MEAKRLFLISYVQIHIDNPQKYDDPDIFFAGLTETQEEAEILARSCTINLKNGTIIPKILAYEDDMSLLDMMYDAADKFQTILLQMKEMHNRLLTAKKKKK